MHLGKLKVTYEGNNAYDRPTAILDVVVRKGKLATIDEFDDIDYIDHVVSISDAKEKCKRLFSGNGYLLEI